MLNGPPDPIELERALGAVLRGALGRAPAPVCVGRYRVRERLGEGATGVVWDADDDLLARRVAIKRLGALDGSLPGQGRREALALARLSHPHVVQVYELVREGGDLFMVMERVSGPTLRQWLARATGWRARLDLFVQAGRGLAAAHAAGIVHRDFKPDNVVITAEGVAKVLDFGLAAAPRDHYPTSRSGRSSSSSSRSETLRGGTPAYMAPEQFDGRPVDARADQYALCLALHEALVGRPTTLPGRPPAATPLVARPAIDAEAVPPGVLVALRRGLAADPGDRWPCLSALLDRLEQLRRPRRVPRAWRLSLAGAALAGLVGLVGLAPPAGPDRDCEAHGRRVVSRWSEAARAEARGAFWRAAPAMAPTTWPRADRALRERFDRWALEHRVTCAAAPRSPAEHERLAARRLCIAQRGDALATLATLFTEADADVVANAVDSVLALRTASSCDPAEPSPRQTTPSVAMHQLNTQLVRSETLASAGRTEEAALDLDRLATSLGEDAPAPLRARVYLSRGWLRLGQSRYEEASHDLTQAFWLSRSAPADDRLAAHAAARMVVVAGRYRSELAEAERWAAHARSALARSGPAPQVEVDLHNCMGGALDTAGRYADALEQYERALAILRRHHEAGTPLSSSQTQMLAVRANAAHMRDLLGEPRRARDELERILREDRALRGDVHPAHVKYLLMLGQVEQGLDRLGAARDAFEAADALATATRPDEPAILGAIKLALGIVAQLQDQLDDAQRHFEDGRRLLAHALGDDHPDVGTAEFNLGLVAHERGDLPRADVHLGRSLDILRVAGGDDQPMVGDVQHELAVVAMKRGDCDAARAHRREAARIFTLIGGADAERGARLRAADERDDCVVPPVDQG